MTFSPQDPTGNTINEGTEQEMGIESRLTLNIVKRTCEKGEATPGYLLFKRVLTFLETMEFDDATNEQYGIPCKFDTKWDECSKKACGTHLRRYSDFSFCINDRNFWFERFAVDFLAQKRREKPEIDNSAVESKDWKKSLMKFCRTFDCEVHYRSCAEPYKGQTVLHITKNKVDVIREPRNTVQAQTKSRQELDESKHKAARRKSRTEKFQDIENRQEESLPF